MRWHSRSTAAILLGLAMDGPGRRLACLQRHVAVSTDAADHGLSSVRALETGASHPARRFTVAVLGAAGGIGQPLSLLLMQNPNVAELRLYDVVNTPGVAADLSHMDTGVRVRSFVKQESLSDALRGCHLVVIPAGVPRKPGMTRDDLFNINAGIVRSLCEAIAHACPHAWVNIISNPVNSTVPIAHEVFRSRGVDNAARVFGVTTLDVVRANTFFAEAIRADPNQVAVPVIGGHAGKTILPLFSQARPSPWGLAPADLEALTVRTQNAGTEVVEAKAGAGSATLSMAYAAARFAGSCLRAMAGEPGVTECAFVKSGLAPPLPFFASPLRLGPAGVSEFLPLGKLSDYERRSLEDMKEELAQSIRKGVEFAGAPPPGQAQARAA